MKANRVKASYTHSQTHTYIHKHSSNNKLFSFLIKFAKEK